MGTGSQFNAMYIMTLPCPRSLSATPAPHRMPLPAMLAAMLLVLLLGALPVQPAAAAVYVYRLPDGSHLITDRRYRDAAHELIRVTGDASEVGRLASPRYHSRRHETLARYDALIKETAARYGVDAALVKAIVHTESYFNPEARSRSGAIGLMQLMPRTAERYGVSDIYDPAQNIDAGVKHLKYLLGRYPSRLAHALAAYNAGERAVETYDGIPPYAETRRYVRKVMDFHAYYRTWF